MAELPNGINGPFIGRIGNMVGYMRCGKNVIRLIGDAGPHKGGQLNNEMKMKLISPIAKLIEGYLNFGFGNVPRKDGVSPRSYAISLNKQVAVKGTYPNLKTDFEKLVISDGPIPEPLNPAVKLKNNVLEFTWEADLEAEGVDEQDQIMILVYFPKRKKAIQLLSGARRTEEFQQIKLPGTGKNDVIETYMSFIADDRKSASPSVYVSQLTWRKK
jgi:hypothetical protein